MHTQITLQSKQKLFNFILKWFRGAEKTSKGIEFQKNIELTKNE